MAITLEELTIRVFLSSPGDVKEERLIAYREVTSFINHNSHFLKKHKVRLEPIGWDRAGAYVPMEANAGPQHSINKRLPQSSECDIAIFIFWSRMGTELDSNEYIKPESYQYNVDKDEIRSQYFSGTEFEFIAALMESSKGNNNHPHSFVFVHQPPASISLDDSKFDEKKRQFSRLKRFLDNIKYKNNSAKVLNGHYEKYENSEDFRDKLQKTLKTIVAEIVKDPPSKMLTRNEISQQKHNAPWVGSPFPGLRTFQEVDERIYFGRDKEVAQLIDQIRENRFVAVIGASGAGKSSLIRAGIIPALKHNAIKTPRNDTRDWDEPQDWIVESNQWVVITMKPGESEEVGKVDEINIEYEEEFKNPFDALYRSLTKEFSFEQNEITFVEFKKRIEEPAVELITIDNADTVTNENEIEHLKTKIEFYREDLSSFTDLLLTNLSHNTEIFLLIDQFEEIFTLVKDINLRKAFIVFMQQFVLGSRARILITMRADFYQDYIMYMEPTKRNMNSTFTLAPPGLGALNEMIRCPAEESGLTFEENVAERILVDTNTDKNSGALPLMAYLLDQMYERCTTGILTMDAYNELGGVGKAITTSAETVINSLRTKIPTIDKLLYTVFKELVELKEIGKLTRRRASKAKIIADKDTEQLVNRLIEARLLFSDNQIDPITGDREEVVEVAHEALLQEWDRLAKWIGDNQDYFLERNRIEIDATEWINNGEDASYLWQQKELIPFYKTLDRLSYLPNIFPPIIQRFIEPESLRIIKELNLAVTDHKRRQAIGERLLELSDPRYGLGVNSNRIPQIAWCKNPVPAGKVNLEGLDKPFSVNQFYIAKYPVTLGQYKAFIDALDGYKNEEWWVGLDIDPQNHKMHPQTPSAAYHPAVWVSWFQAIVFCRWLSHKLGFEVRIPYEWEWQQAATGGNPANIYPWGPTWDENCCNSYNSELNSLVSVGLYPNGKSPIGAEDMAGNAVEWCINTFEQPDREINFQDHSKRTTRGGAYFLAPSQRQEGKSAKDVVNTTCRLGDDPSAPAEGRVRVAIRLVANYVPTDQLIYPELGELKGIPQSISNYYLHGNSNQPSAES